ncbi:hypothetical protein [Pontibacter sp. G13]|uniref:hypothetical protein n=1 Tax=Pontibacter sp. G13 TaxID=3074898 RepID=UPI00288C3555|nr:hypothetical protein [Pontibacter sp. G13]WNJ17867.1 hypothetical protein RJD25_23690 [Pontibacter sp. G13]
MNRIIFSACMAFSLFLMDLQSFAQNPNQVQEALGKTWYAVKVGEPEGGEMRPTRREEVLMFNLDGTMKIKADGGNEYNGTWEYQPESSTIHAEISFQGMERETELKIRKLTDDQLVLVDPQRATEYSTSPRDPNVKPKEAPTVVNSVSTIEVENWTGLHPFNQKVMTSADDQRQKVESIGVIVLIRNGNQKVLRINDDGVTTDIPVSEGSEIAGERHFGFVTDDPTMAGEVVFREDGSFYIYRDQDQSVTEYVKE